MKMKTLLTAALAFFCFVSAASAQTLQETVSYIFLFPVEHQNDRTISGSKIETRTGDTKQVVIVNDKSPCVVEVFEEGRKSGREADTYKQYTKLSLDRVSEWKIDESSGPVHLWLLGTGPVTCASSVYGKAASRIDFDTVDLQCLYISRLTIGTNQTIDWKNRDPNKTRKAVEYYRAHFCKGRAF